MAWKVTADHPMFSRPDKYFASFDDAFVYANDLRRNRYENIKFFEIPKGTPKPQDAEPEAG